MADLMDALMTLKVGEAGSQLQWVASSKLHSALWKSTHNRR